MASGGRKGRVSNDLVAASCAAVLAVYAAGYWRTRDAARRLEAQSQERRAPRSEVARAEAPTSVVEPSAPEPPPPAPVVASPPPAAPTPVAPAPPPAEAKSVAKADPPPPKAAAPVASSTTPPAKPAPVAAVAPVPTDEELAAKAAAEHANDPPAKPVAHWIDGTYTGWGTSNHGDIESRIVIQGGRIVEAGIATCATRYPCDVIDRILNQPVLRQSPEIDNVSRATESADAYYYGILQALRQATPETPTDAAATAP